MNISILIPVYNSVCLELVKSLQAQATLLHNYKIEIIVADDGSTNMDTVSQNETINKIPNSRYIHRKKNEGRAAIRNFLAQQAKYDWLLYIDCGMAIHRKNYIKTYCLQSDNTPFHIIYGGYQISEETPDLSHNLRYIYEKHSKKNCDFKLRQQHPYQDFHTSNFLVLRDIMLANPLDENFTHYGYEDVLWGKTIQEKNIKIKHVDNPVFMNRFADNNSFTAKTEEAMRTLHLFSDQMQGYSKLLAYYNKIKKYHLSKCLTMTYNILGKSIRKNLVGNNPRLFLFNIYKLLYFSSLS